MRIIAPYAFTIAAARGPRSNISDVRTSRLPDAAFRRTTHEDISRIKAQVIEVVAAHHPAAKCLEYSSVLTWFLRQSGLVANLAALLENGDPLHFYVETDDFGAQDIFPQGYTTETFSDGNNAITWELMPDHYLRCIESLEGSVPGVFSALKQIAGSAADS